MEDIKDIRNIYRYMKSFQTKKKKQKVEQELDYTAIKDIRNFFGLKKKMKMKQTKTES